MAEVDDVLLNNVLEEQRQTRSAVDAMRAEQTAFFAGAAGKFATLETQMRSLVGDGQSGEIPKLASRVTDLEKASWKLTGGCAALICGVEFLVHFSQIWDFFTK